MAQRRAVGLRRDLPSGAIIATIFGNIASACFLVLGVTAQQALGLTPLLFLVAGFIILIAALTYVEGIAMLPQAGGASGFARSAFNDLVSFLTAWALLLDYTIVIAAAAFFASHYLSALPGLDWLADSPWDILASITLILGVAMVNARGLRIGARLAVTVSGITLIFQLLLAVVGLALLFEPSVLTQTLTWSGVPTWEQLRFALPVAMIGFIGIEVVANLSSEMQDPERRMPRSMMYATVVAVLLYVVMSIVGLSALPVQEAGINSYTELGTTWVDRPFIGIIEQLPVSEILHDVLGIVTGVLAAFVLFLTANSSMLGVSRLTYAMSRNRQAPGVLGRINRGEGVPIVAVTVFTVFAILLLLATAALQDSALVLAQLYAFGAMFAIGVASLSLIRLRFTHPDLPRPYRAPVNVMVRGRAVSLATVLAFLLAGWVWGMVLDTHDTARVLGMIWMIAGFMAYATYRLTHGLSLVGRATERADSGITVEARHYRRVLIAVRPERGRLWGAGDAELVSMAHKLLDDRADGELAVMLVHELPLTQPLNAPLGSIETVTTERLSMLRRVALGFDVRLTSTVARARAAGRALCQEAERRDADVVVLAIRAKQRPGDEVFGRTVTYVLRHAPCDVIVMSFPEESLRKLERRTKLATTAGNAEQE